MLNISQIPQLDLSVLTFAGRTWATPIVTWISAWVIIFEVIYPCHHIHIFLNIAQNALNWVQLPFVVLKTAVICKFREFFVQLRQSLLLLSDPYCRLAWVDQFLERQVAESAVEGLDYAEQLLLFDSCRLLLFASAHAFRFAVFVANRWLVLWLLSGGVATAFLFFSKRDFGFSGEELRFAAWLLHNLNLNIVNTYMSWPQFLN